MTGVVNDTGKLLGIFTDGDLRRTLAKQINVDTPIHEVMTVNPTTSRPDMLAAELVSIMKQHKIGAILVTDDSGVIGALNMQDLLRAGVL